MPFQMPLLPARRPRASSGSSLFAAGNNLDGDYDSPSSDDSSDTVRGISSSSAARHSHGGIMLNPFSDADEDEPSSPLLGPTRWWDSDSTRRRRRRDHFSHSSLGFSWQRRVKRSWAVCTAHPLVPTQPLTILFSLVLFTLFAILLTLFLIYYLNPDKEALPWRTYCALQKSFPPENLAELTPAGVFLGVFSMDSALERRMFVRTTFASHNRSRVDDGTSRTIVRFILGQPRGEWERRIQLEAETYNDIVILPIKENMNSGKTHAYFTWAAQHAWVPPPISPLQFSYANQTAPVPPLAPHDPFPSPHAPHHWVRPDFVIKADDDSFVMLAELEARLRVEMHSGSSTPTTDVSPSVHSSTSTPNPGDPLIYWGYLVKNKFMGGELYGLSWDVVTWVAQSEAVKSLTRGAEDKLVAQWMLIHPRAGSVIWRSERCWIYDHPKAGTVYSHGFLFPSEASRVRKSLTGIVSDTDPSKQKTGAPEDTEIYSHSSVTTFGTRYSPPVSNLTPLQSIEALVEGSAMSKLNTLAEELSHGTSWRTYNGRYGDLSGAGAMNPERAIADAVKVAWSQREGRLTRYEGQKLGGTVVVHFIKRNEWWEETALALLGGEDVVRGDVYVPLPIEREDSTVPPDTNTNTISLRTEESTGEVLTDVSGSTTSTLQRKRAHL